MSAAALRRVLAYGAVLALAAVVLAWADYQRLARTRFGDLALALTAAGFLLLGLFAGWRLFGRGPQRAEGNPPAVAALGISGRELEVLAALAAGQATLIHGDFAQSYGDAMIAQQRAAGASAAEIAKTTREAAEFVAQYRDPLFRWPMTFAEIVPVGVLVSLISAALLRNPRFMPARG